MCGASLQFGMITIFVFLWRDCYIRIISVCFIIHAIKNNSGKTCYFFSPQIFKDQGRSALIAYLNVDYKAERI